MILDANQLAAIQQHVDELIRRGGTGLRDPSLRTIQDLLHTVAALKKEKRKWKRVAQNRGKVLTQIAEMVGKGEEDEEP
jgi:hypothetical protein